jgi:hypothetical protein
LWLIVLMIPWSPDRAHQFWVCISVWRQLAIAFAVAISV